MASNPERVYALRVKGLSMIDALIDDGDIVVLESGSEVRDGDMVAAWLVDEREVTLKRLYREGDRVRLQPANSQMAPIYVDARNVEVHGRVVGVIRWLG
jgi:repressor LexA